MSILQAMYVKEKQLTSERHTSEENRKQAIIARTAALEKVAKHQ